MTSVSRLALGAMLALGGSAVLFTAAADAQGAPRGNRAREAQVQAQGRTLNLSREERAALVALETAVRGTDRAAQDAALAAARPVARGADARYALGGFQLALAQQRNDNQMALQALDLLVDSGQAPPEELARYLDAQKELALGLRDYARAERAIVRLLQLRPNDSALIINLAQIRQQQGNGAEALQLVQRAIAARQAAGGEIPQSWLQFSLRSAYDSRDPQMRARSVGLARALVAAHPTPQNWRQALLIYRELGNLDTASQLDVWRLMLAAGALTGERDYYDFANALNQGGYPAEAKAVLDAGIAAGMVTASRSPFRELIATATARIPADRSDLPASQRAAMAAATGTPALRTGDAFFGYGRYPEAIALYLAALQKGGVDANVVNTRLGIAYALAGQRTQAEAAFRAVTGPRAELAQFWLTWLQRRP